MLIVFTLKITRKAYHLLHEELPGFKIKKLIFFFERVILSEGKDV